MAFLADAARALQIKRLIQQLTDPARRSQAAAELLKHGPPAVVPLLEAAAGPDAAVQSAAAQILLRMGPAAVPALCTALDQAHPLLRAAAADLLGRIRHPSALPALARAARGEYFTVRARAALALAAIGDPQALPTLLPLLRDPEAQVRGAAALAVGRFRQPQTFAALAALLQDNDIAVRRQSARALGLTRHPAVLPYLVDALRDPFWWFEREQEATELLEAIEQIGAPAVDALLEALNDPEPQVRRFAALLLGRIRDPRAIEPLGMALYDIHFHVGQAAAEALAAYGAPALDILLGAAHHLEAPIRVQAALGLERIGGPLAEDALLALLDDPDRDVRAQVIRSLGALRVARARPRLEQIALNRSDRELAALARQVLTSLG